MTAPIDTAALRRLLDVADEVGRLRAAVVSAVGVLRRGGDGLDYVTACEAWDGSQRCTDRGLAPCDACIAAAQVADAVRLLEMGGPFEALAATESRRCTCVGIPPERDERCPEHGSARPGQGRCEI